MVYSCSRKVTNCVLENVTNCQETEDFIQLCVLLSSKKAEPDSNQDRKRRRRIWSTTEQETSHRSSTGSFIELYLQVSTLVSMPTVRRRLQDAVLLGRVAKGWWGVLWMDEFKFEVFGTQKSTFEQ